MAGVSGEHDMIVMTMNGTDFLQSFINKEEQVKIRLVKRDKRPMLNVELLLSNILKSIPVKIHNNTQLQDYLTPTVNPAVIGLNVAPFGAFQNFVATFADLKIPAMVRLF